MTKRSTSLASLQQSRVETIALRYYPTWWVLTDCAPPGYPTFRPPDALQRLEAIIHEAFHVWWFQKFGAPLALSPKSVSNPLEEEVERECLVRALTAKSEEESRQWAKAFLHARHQRRQRQGMTKEQIKDERVKEMLEGLATFVSWQGLKAGASEEYQPLKAIKADPEFFGYRVRDEQVLINTLSLRHPILGRAHAFGLAKVMLLERWGKRWRHKVPAKDLESLLEEGVARTSLPKDFFDVKEERGEKESEVKGSKEGEKTEVMEPPESSVTIWLSLPKGLLEEIERMHCRHRIFSLEAELELEADDLIAVVEGPFWVRIDKGRQRLGILWDRSKQLSLQYRSDGFVTLQGEGLLVQGRLIIQRERDEVFLCPVKKAKKSHKEVFSR